MKQNRENGGALVQHFFLYNYYLISLTILSPITITGVILPLLKLFYLFNCNHYISLFFFPLQLQNSYGACVYLLNWRIRIRYQNDWQRLLRKNRVRIGIKIMRPTTIWEWEMGDWFPWGKWESISHFLEFLFCPRWHSKFPKMPLL